MLFESGRYRVVGPPAWRELSRRRMARLHSETQARALRAVGLEAPIDSTQVRPLLRHLASESGPVPVSMGAKLRAQDAGELDTLKIDEHRAIQPIWFAVGDNPLTELKGIAVDLAASERLEEWQAVEYLLADELPYGLPWIEVDGALRGGDSTVVEATIYVGTLEIAAEDIRSAYVEAVRREIGSERSSRAPSADELELLLHEEEARENRRSWEDAWLTWIPKARDLGATEYEDKEAYRNKINSLCKRFPWMREDLALYGQRNSPEYLAAMRSRRGGEDQ